MEYLLIVSFAFLLLTAIIFVALSQSSSFSSEVTAAQIQKVAHRIVDAADAAYYAGPPTKKSFSLYFPDNILEANVTGKDVVFRVSGTGGNYEYALSSSTNLSGTLRTFKGVHHITVEATDSYVLINDT